MKSVDPIVIREEETGKEYTLEFTLETVRFAESKGFDVRDIPKFPATKIPELWFYAFRAHHKNVARNKTDMLFYALGGFSNDVITARLGDLYAVPFRLNESIKDSGFPKVSIIH